MPAREHRTTILAHETHTVDVRGRELWTSMGQRGWDSPALLTSKPRNVRKTISLSIHSLGFSATLCYLRHGTTYLNSPSSAVRRSWPARPAPVWAPRCAPHPPLCGQNDLTRTWVRQVIPAQNAPSSGRHPGLWWHQAPGACPQPAALASKPKPGPSTQTQTLHTLRPLTAALC